MLFSSTREGQICWEVIFQKKLTFPGKSYFPGSHIFFEKTFPWKSNFQEITYTGNSHFTQKLTSSRKFNSSQNFKFSREITSGNSHFQEVHIFPGNQLLPGISLVLPGISNFPGKSHFNREVTFPGKSQFPGSQ